MGWGGLGEGIGRRCAVRPQKKVPDFAAVLVGIPCRMGCIAQRRWPHRSYVERRALRNRRLLRLMLAGAQACKTVRLHRAFTHSRMHAHTLAHTYAQARPDLIAKRCGRCTARGCGSANSRARHIRCRCSAPSQSRRCHICPRTLGSPLPHLHRDLAHPGQICIGPELTLATSAPGVGSPRPHLHRA